MASVADSGEPRRARPAAALLAVVAGALVSLAFPPIGLPLAAAGLVRLHVRHGALAAAAAAFVAGAATFVLDPTGPLYVTLWLLVVGPVTVGLLKRSRFESAVLAVAVAVAAVWAGAVVGAAAAQGTDVATMFRTTMQQAVSQGLVGAPQAGIGSAEAKRQVEELVSTMVRILPAVLAFLAGVTAVGSVGAATVVLRRLGVEVRGVPPLAEFDLDPRVVWALIAALVLMAVDKFSHGWRGGLLGVVGENLLLTMRWVLFAQGVAVFAGLYERVKVSKAGRAFGYATLAITEAFVPLVSLTGLVDVWLNFRKLPRDGRTDASRPSV
ncbi:YybS family protein [Coriobacteriia bacterium Es71-Z0120]|uniref:DUF2232 domain-containing protein n=1 Tax=Parvivirga hydrogeniphila TaxID=2939460 RepID=UPI002260A848|nr:DUF2232 domain-containing protein [Parvivirga hydrogeniphila]MCL4078137.1 YybS family protein [Parvivirga hydrogeniphila]